MGTVDSGGSVTRLRELVAQWEARREEFRRACRSANHDGKREMDAYYDGKAMATDDCINNLRDQLAAALAPAVVPDMVPRCGSCGQEFMNSANVRAHVGCTSKPAAPPVVAPVAAPVREQTRHWAVMVDRNGENVITIETNHLSGRDISDEDARVIRLCAENLLSFAGSE